MKTNAPIRASKLWATRSPDERLLFESEMAAQHWIDIQDEEDEAVSLEGPVCVIPASARDIEAMIDQCARALDGLAFHEYKAGECLPRGHEMDSIEKVNEIQGFRRRTAISKAKAVLRSLGILSALNNPTP